jgi:hypothetical protein
MATNDRTNTTANSGEQFAFGKQNYKYMLIGIAVVVLGFILMMGGGSDDPMVFNEEIFSTRRITVAPIVVLIGYGIIFYAILKRAKSSAEKQ